MIGIFWGASGREAAWFLYNLVANEVQKPFLRLANHLLVRNSSLRGRIPIDHAATAIDQTLVVQIYENFLNSGRIRIIKRISLARPIA
jgi:hypothetical protein